MANIQQRKTRKRSGTNPRQRTGARWIPTFTPAA